MKSTEHSNRISLGRICRQSWLVWVAVIAVFGAEYWVKADDAQPSAPESSELAEAMSRGVDFNRDILPILSDRCFACHGPDAASRHADLRLDSFEDATTSLASGGKAIVPGNPKASKLIERVTTEDEDYRMPPPDSNLQLTPEEQRLLSRWIEEGAEYEKHWSFEPLPAEIPVPDITGSATSSSPIGRFVVARLEAEGLQPSPAADRHSWLRRVTYDLTGLPPTPEQIDAFLSDHSEDAFEAVVDRLLQSPHFGERMAIPWLDLARYADSYGYQADLLSPTWPWRDWVIRAFNDNLPFDQFITWQLAGDMLPNASGDQNLATAFNRLHRMTNEGGSIAEEFRCESVADRVSTLGTAVLGLTVECARCHDHKFDPLTQREFYALSAMFDNIDEWGTYHDSQRVPTPSVLLPTDDQPEQWEKLKSAVVEADQSVEEARQGGEPRYREWLRSDSMPAEIPGLVGHYPLDSVNGKGTLANTADSEKPGSTSRANRIVDGHIDQALQLVGDEAAEFPGICGALSVGQAYTVAMWLKVPANASNGILFHRSGGTDIGYHGTELALRDGQLFFGSIRYWPGNAIAVESVESLPKDRWVHVAATYDATNTATGMHLYVDGRRVDRVVRDNLYKDPQQGGDGLTFGQRFRGASIKNLLLDELRAFDRELTAVEVAQLCDGQSLSTAIHHRDADRLRDYYYANFDEPTSRARKASQSARAKLLQFQTGMKEIMVMRELAEPRPSHVLARGEYDAEKTEATLVDPGTPAFLGLESETAEDRLDLAHWLTHPNHPLTSRVAVNRFWQLFFGNGIVESSENFGTQGSPPSHPELLDWLARDFVDSGWDVKRLCKQIVLSDTYRQTSVATPDLREHDPHNRLLARGPSSRLSAEMIRDTVLSASGLLNPEIGGPPVSPYQPPNLWKESNSMSPAYKQSVGQSLYRRSLYTVVKRTAPPPNMVAFDMPSREVCTARRATTNTPISALVLLNDVQYVEACRVLAERTLRANPTPAEQVQQVFLRLTGREASEQELTILVDTFDQQREFYSEHPEWANHLVGLGEAPPADDLDPIELAAATVVTQTILNLDATVWKR